MKHLASLIAGDNAAFEKLCAVYSETVRSMARSFIARNPTTAHLKDDLISEGVLAVVTALRAIQATKDVDEKGLPGYMATAIWHGFLLAIENEQTIKVPLKKRKYYKSEFTKLKQSSHELTEVPEREHGDLSDLMDSLRAACRDDAEEQVIKQRALGVCDRVIAASLGCSESTVCRMRQRVEKRYREENE